MLKKVTVQNFVYFREKQTLHFTSGPYYLIGENDSGKSSLFEIIRRCMGLKKSTGLTKPHDQRKQSIAICQFVFNDNENKKKEVISAFMRPITEGEIGDLYVKLVYVKSEDQIEEIGIDVIKEIDNDSGTTDLRWKSLSTDKLKAALQESAKELHDSPDELLEIVHEGISKLPHVTLSLEDKSTEKTISEQLLKKYINKTTVITFPLRSISPCQWTKSKRLRHQTKKENIDEVYLKEEIVSWYLEKVNDEKNPIPKEEIALEQKYFRQITNNSDFNFKFDKTIKRIYVENTTFEENKPFLLKVPEGIYEAKKLSIMLAVKQFKTVCLEDPERGMHPQMIERIRDLVLTQINDKVILLISHHPNFLSPTTFARVYYFRIELAGGRRASVIRPLQKNPDDPNNAKNARIFTCAQSSVLYYAKTLCLVEGDSDYVFLTTLKQLLLTKDDLLQKVLNGEQNEETLEDFRQFLCSLHVLTMTGEANKHKYREFCSDLQIRRYFLLDQDALYQNNPGQKKPKSPERFLELFEIDHSEIMCDKVENDVSVLETYGVFMWQAGAIEEAAAALAARCKSLEESFDTNNVHLEHIINKLKTKNEARSVAPQNEHKTDESAGNVDAGDSSANAVETKSSTNTNLKPKKKHKEGGCLEKAELDKPKRKLKKRDKRKLFNDDNLTNENIVNVVEDIVSIEDTQSEFRRLIWFLNTMSKTQVVGKKSD